MYKQKHSARRIVILCSDIHEPRNWILSNWSRSLLKNGDEPIILTCGKRKFSELDGVKIVEVKTWVPRNVFGYFKFTCDFLRSIMCSVWVNQCTDRPDVIVNFCDPIALFVLRCLGAHHVIHVLNSRLLMAPPSLDGIVLRKVWYHERCLLYAGTVIVDTKIAHFIMREKWNKRINLRLLYNYIDNKTLRSTECCALTDFCPDAVEGGGLFVCFGPMIKKTRFDIVIEAFNKIMSDLPLEIQSQCHLIIASSVNNAKSMEMLANLQKLSMSLKYGLYISYLTHLPLVHRKTLIRKSLAVIFPIMDNYRDSKSILECMYLGKPIIATNDGIHIELIRHRITGYLLPPVISQFSSVMFKLALYNLQAMNIGLLCEEEYKNKYNCNRFRENVNNIIIETLNPNQKRRYKEQKTKRTLKKSKTDPQLRVTTHKFAKFSSTPAIKIVQPDIARTNLRNLIVKNMTENIPDC